MGAREMVEGWKGEKERQGRRKWEWLASEKDETMYNIVWKGPKSRSKILVDVFSPIEGRSSWILVPRNNGCTTRYGFKALEDRIEGWDKNEKSSRPLRASIKGRWIREELSRENCVTLLRFDYRMRWLVIKEEFSRTVGIVGWLGTSMVFGINGIDSFKVKFMAVRDERFY